MFISSPWCLTSVLIMFGVLCVCLNMFKNERKWEFYCLLHFYYMISQWRCGNVPASSGRLLRCQRLEAQRETTLNNVSFINQSSLFVKTCKSKNDSIDFKIGNNSSWHNTSPRNFCNRIELSEKKELTDELIHKSTWPKTPHIKKYTHTHITHLRQLPWK